MLIKIFQIEYDSINGLQKVSGTEYVYSTNTPSINTMTVTNSPSIKKSIEEREGIFHLDSVKLSVLGIPNTYFDNYDVSTMQDKPFVVYIKDENTGDILFSGVVDVDDAEYNATTKELSFRALEWLYLLRNKKVAARYVFETDLAEEYNYKDNGKFVLPRNVDTNGDEIGDTDLSTFLEVGDVIVFSSDGNEWRTAILSKTVGNDTITVDTAYTGEKTLATGSDGYTAIFTDGPAPVGYGAAKMLITTNNEYVKSLIGVKDSNAYDYRVRLTHPVTGDILDLNVTDIINFGSSTPSIIATVNATFYQSLLDASLQKWNNISNVQFELYTVYKILPSGNGVSRVKLLGRNIYGYYAGGAGKDYPLGNVVDAMFNLPDFGIVQHVFQNVVYDGNLSATTHKLSPYLEYDEQPIKALIQMLNTFGLFVRLDLSLNVDDIPVFDVRLLQRTDVLDTVITPVGLSNVLKPYSEKVASAKPKAVVVKSNKQYFKRKYDNEIVGFYYDGIESLTFDETKLLGLPNGDGVISFTVMQAPSHFGIVFYGDGKPVTNDFALKNIAQRLFNFYAGLDQTTEFVVYGSRLDVLGKMVTVNEILGGRTIFVVGCEYDLKNNLTKISGRIGNYIPLGVGAVKAIIDGRTVWFDDDNDNNVTINLDAGRSYSEDGDTNLTYEWKVGTTVVGTDRILQYTDTVPAGGKKVTITLTVTNSGGNSDTTSRTFWLIDNIFDEIFTPFVSLFDIGKNQNNTFSPPKGELRLYPRINRDIIDSVKYRVSSGELDEIVTEADFDQTAVWVNDDGLGRGYYQCVTDLSEKHISVIEVRVTFLPTLGIEPMYYHTSFDANRYPNVNFALYLNGSDAYLSYEGDEDTTGIEYVVSTTGIPSDFTGSVTVSGRQSDGVLIYSGLVPTTTVYVRARGLNDNDGFVSQTDFTGSITYFGDGSEGIIVPTVTPTYTQLYGTGDGRVSLDLTDPENRITRIVVDQRTNTGDWTNRLDTTTIYDPTVVDNITLSTKHNTQVRWFVYWDDGSASQVITGEFTFDVDATPEGKATLEVESDGSVYLSYDVDEDTTAVEYVTDTSAFPTDFTGSVTAYISGKGRIQLMQSDGVTPIDLKVQESIFVLLRWKNTALSIDSANIQLSATNNTYVFGIDLNYVKEDSTSVEISVFTYDPKSSNSVISLYLFGYDLVYDDNGIITVVTNDEIYMKRFHAFTVNKQYVAKNIEIYVTSSDGSKRLSESVSVTIPKSGPVLETKDFDGSINSDGSLLTAGSVGSTVTSKIVATGGGRTRLEANTLYVNQYDAVGFARHLLSSANVHAIRSAADDTETSFLQTIVGTKTIPANAVKDGSVISFEMLGTYTGGGNTFNLNVKLGSVVMATTGGLVLPNELNNGFRLKGLIVVKTAGSSGLATCQSVIEFFGNGLTSDSVKYFGKTDVAIDTTISNDFDITGWWGILDLNEYHVTHKLSNVTLENSNF